MKSRVNAAQNEGPQIHRGTEESKFEEQSYSRI